MAKQARQKGHRRRGLLRANHSVCLAAALATLAAGAASAYVGDSFINIPGSPGHYQGKEHRGWIRAEANDWPGRAAMTRRLSSGSGDPLAGDKLFFGGPAGARPGSGGTLVV